MWSTLLVSPSVGQEGVFEALWEHAGSLEGQGSERHCHVEGQLEQQQGGRPAVGGWPLPGRCSPEHLVGAGQLHRGHAGAGPHCEQAFGQGDNYCQGD